MEELYNQLKQAITVLDANIFVEELQNYNGFKLTGTRGRKVRSFVDIYVQNECLKIQISNIDYLDPKNLVQDSPNESWTLNKLIYVNNYDEINHALAIIEQSYLHIRGIVNEFDEYKDARFEYVQAGPRDISFIFHKELDGSDLDHIVYETRQESLFSNNFLTGMSFTIDNLEEKKALWRNELQPNANKVFEGKVAKLMIKVR
jgi:predicted transport protein